MGASFVSRDVGLVRAIGLFGLTAAIVNVTIGGGIYRLPAAAAAGLGAAAPLAYVACAVMFAFIVICFAEAGSRVSLTGGIYAYVEVAFGPLAGLVTGVLLWAALSAAFAAVVSFLADALAAVVPVFASPVPRAALLLVVLGAMAALNVRGVRLADRFNAVATVVKVAPLLMLLAGGVFAIDPANLAFPPLPPLSDVAKTSAILVFAFLGIETALVPTGEVAHPERTVPRAAFLAIAVVAFVYLGLHLVAQGVLGPSLATQKMPLAEAAGLALGGWARQAVLGASILSILIYASGMMLALPRLLFAFGRDGFAPAAVAAVHPRFHTPHVAILAQATLVAALAISGTFEQLALLGNAGGLLSYVMCCAAAWQLRRKDVRMTETRYDVPGAGIAPPIAIVLIGWLLTGISRAEWIASAVVMAVAVVVYVVRRPGTLMLLRTLVECVERVRATPRKLEKVALLAGLLRPARGREAELAALYLTGTLPQGRIGLGWRTLQSVMADAAAGGEPLTLVDVDRVCDEIAGESGPGSVDRKGRALRALFARASPEESRFLVELFIGEVRQGALEGLLVDAIARAADLPAADVRQSAMYAGSIGELARVALEEGAAGLTRFSLRLLSPVSPMLASTADDVDAAIERLGPAAFEYKLDGARIQVHKAGDEVRVFTRHLQDVTARVPEVVEWARALGVREAVVEGEAIAMRPDGRPHAFQVTGSRIGKSKDVEAARRATPLTSYFFDCLYLEGEGPLVALPYAERVERLARIAPASLLPRIVTSDRAEADRFLRGALDAGHEGLMAKSLSAPYAAGHRGFHWLKLKTAHTLDLVVIGVEWGSGRRKGWLSNLHLGARDAESGQFVMLGKTFKGLTDEMLRWQTETLGALETSRDEFTVYVRPEVVVEIAFSDVQESTRYPAGMALRFARVKRYRTDKTAAEADTLQAVREIFRRQRA